MFIIDKKRVNLTVIISLSVTIGFGILFEKLFYIIGGAEPGSGAAAMLWPLSPINEWGERLKTTLIRFLNAYGGDLSSVDPLVKVRTAFAIIFYISTTLSAIYGIVAVVKKKQLIPFVLSLSFFIAHALIITTRLILTVPEIIRYYQSLIFISAIINNNAISDINKLFIKTHKLKIPEYMLTLLSVITLSLISIQNDINFKYPVNNYDFLLTHFYT